MNEDKHVPFTTSLIYIYIYINNKVFCLTCELYIYINNKVKQKTLLFYVVHIPRINHMNTILVQTNALL